MVYQNNRGTLSDKAVLKKLLFQNHSQSGMELVMIMSDKPNRCQICGNFLTTSAQLAGYRCVDPGHWLAAGVLTPTDYLPMAKIVAGTSPEPDRQFVNQSTLNLNG